MSDTPERYEICVKGQLGEQWAAWFEDVTIASVEDGQTRLICRVIDQAALHGILRKVRDLGVELLSVNRVDAD